MIEQEDRGETPRAVDGPADRGGPSDADEQAARRRFLDLCGKFAIGMPPAIALLIASPAQADHSAGGGHSGCVPPQNPHDPPCP